MKKMTLFLEDGSKVECPKDTEVPSDIWLKTSLIVIDETLTTEEFERLSPRWFDNI